MSAIAQLFRQLTHGVYVVGVAHGSEYNAFTAALVMQASFDPLLLALSINPRHASYPLLITSGAFTVNYVMPVKTGIQEDLYAPHWTPAFAGVTVI